MNTLACPPCRPGDAPAALRATAPHPLPALARQASAGWPTWPTEGPVGRAAHTAARRAGGRHCAGLALAALGVTGAEVRRGPSGAAIWPDGVVGAITHAAGHSHAAVAWRHDCGALGIDSEPLLDADTCAELWPLVGRPQAAQWLHTLGDRRLAATLAFSAKEAMYKAWHHLLAGPPEFEDLALLRLLPAQRQLWLHWWRWPALPPCELRWAVVDGVVHTVAAHPAAGRTDSAWSLPGP